MNKKPELTQEQRQLMYIALKKNLKPASFLNVRHKIKTGKITMSDISYFEKRYFELFDRNKDQFDGNKDQFEFFAACEQEKDKLQQELNEI